MLSSQITVVIYSSVCLQENTDNYIQQNVENIKKWLYGTSYNVVLIENTGYEYPELSDYIYFFRNKLEMHSFDIRNVDWFDYNGMVDEQRKNMVIELNTMMHLYNISNKIKSSAFAIKLNGPNSGSDDVINFINNQTFDNCYILYSKENGVVGCSIPSYLVFFNPNVDDVDFCGDNGSISSVYLKRSQFFHNDNIVTYSEPESVYVPEPESVYVAEPEPEPEPVYAPEPEPEPEPVYAPEPEPINIIIDDPRIVNNSFSIVKKIINVFQERYGHYNSPGLGDFIRGSLFLIQFCEQRNLECDIYLKNHKINKYLNYISPNFIDNNGVYFIDQFNGCKIYIDGANKVCYRRDHNTTNRFDACIHRYINDREDLFVYTQFFPDENLSDSSKKYMRHVFEPNCEMVDYLTNELINLGLTKKEYHVIHIRYGDDVLIHNREIDTSYIDKIINNSDLINIISSNEPCLLISDSKNVKHILYEKYPSLKVKHDSIIQHVGEGTCTSDDGIRDLLLDFYFIANSKNTLAFSGNQHGSGFSEWTTKIHDIPYACFFIGNKLNHW